MRRRLAGSLLGSRLEEATFGRRGFHSGDTASRAHLERAGLVFLEGYNAAVSSSRDTLLQRLNLVAPEWRGFAFEGASMGLRLLDHLTPWRSRRWAAFLDGPGGPHTYMVHVGAGWALARTPWLRRRPVRILAKMDPLLRWLVIDGYGFHEGYFDWPRSIRDRKVPAALSGYARRAFDQGLGRSLWFVTGADVERVRASILAFAPERHGDLWAGVGLAATYAGGVDRVSLERLRVSSSGFLPHVAQGAAFAAKARERAGNVAPHVDLACRALCGMSATAAARVTDAALADLSDDSDQPAYERWRARIRRTFDREA
jgi:hypothetical protein